MSYQPKLVCVSMTTEALAPGSIDVFRLPL